MRDIMRNMRIDKGLTQKDMSDITGIERSRYCLIENGRIKRVCVDDAYKISCALGSTIEALFLSFDVDETNTFKAS